jgi:hypothetical protein
MGPLDVGSDHPEIRIGTLTATNVRSLISIDEEDVFSIAPPLLQGGPFTINAPWTTSTVAEPSRLI